MLFVNTEQVDPWIPLNRKYNDSNKTTQEFGLVMSGHRSSIYFPTASRRTRRVREGSFKSFNPIYDGENSGSSIFPSRNIHKTRPQVYIGKKYWFRLMFLGSYIGGCIGQALLYAALVVAIGSSFLKWGLCLLCSCVWWYVNFNMAIISTVHMWLQHVYLLSLWRQMGGISEWLKRTCPTFSCICGDLC